MKLSIITVTWNVKALAEKMLSSLFLYLKDIDFEVILVDNESKDSTVNFLTEKFKDEIASGKLKILANDFNAGFSKGNNQGLKIASGEYVLFMNPDMEVLDAGLEKLFVKFENENIGIVGCKLVYADKTIQKSVKGEPGLGNQLLVLSKLHHWLHGLNCLKRFLRTDFDYDKEQEVSQIMGAFILMRKDFLKSLNGWNEDFWLMWDDVDLCQRVRLAGKKIVYSSDATVIHYESQCFAQVPSLNKQKRFNRGMLIYFKKYKPFWQYCVLLLMQPVSYSLAFISQTLKIKQRPQSRI